MTIMGRFLILLTGSLIDDRYCIILGAIIFLGTRFFYINLDYVQPCHMGLLKIINLLNLGSHQKTWVL